MQRSTYCPPLRPPCPPVWKPPSVPGQLRQYKLRQPSAVEIAPTYPVIFGASLAAGFDEDEQSNPMTEPFIIRALVAYHERGNIATTHDWSITVRIGSPGQLAGDAFLNGYSPWGPWTGDPEIFGAPYLSYAGLWIPISTIPCVIVVRFNWIIGVPRNVGAAVIITPAAALSPPDDLPIIPGDPQFTP